MTVEALKKIKHRGLQPPVGVIQLRARGVPELLVEIWSCYPEFDVEAMCGELGVYAGTVREIPGDGREEQSASQAARHGQAAVG